MKKSFNELKENNLIEFKKAKGGLPNSLWTSYSSFANTDGGVIVLGIEENNDMFFSAKLSLEEIDNLRKKFWDTINNTKKVSKNILVDKDVYIDYYEDFPILVINVRRANRSEKPIYINDNVYNETYRRNHNGDYHCTKEEVDLMIKDSSNQSGDKTCLENFYIDDLSKESIFSYKQMLKATNPSHIFLTLSDEEFYLNLGIARKGTDNILHPTKAGLLMFGKEYRITDEFNHYFLDYQDHREETKEIRWIDRIYSSSGEWSGNLFDFFFKVNNKLSSDLPVPFKMNGIQRDDDTLMHKALREALCNTLSNADYYGVRGIVIKKSKDRIEFSNPGIMRISKEEAFLGGSSDPRNETILKIFSLIKIGERAGAGIQTIVNACKMYCFIPKIEETFNPDRTKLTIFLKEVSPYLLKESVTNNFLLNDLSLDEKRTFEFMSDKYYIMRKDLEEYLKYGKTKCFKILKSMLEKGVIKKDGSASNTKYFVKKNIDISK